MSNSSGTIYDDSSDFLSNSATPKNIDVFTTTTMSVVNESRNTTANFVEESVLIGNYNVVQVKI